MFPHDRYVAHPLLLASDLLHRVMKVHSVCQPGGIPERSVCPRFILLCSIKKCWCLMSEQNILFNQGHICFKKFDSFRYRLLKHHSGSSAVSSTSEILSKYADIEISLRSYITSRFIMIAPKKNAYAHSRN